MPGFIHLLRVVLLNDNRKRQIFIFFSFQNVKCEWYTLFMLWSVIHCSCLWGSASIRAPSARSRERIASNIVSMKCLLKNTHYTNFAKPFGICGPVGETTPICGLWDIDCVSVFDCTRRSVVVYPQEVRSRNHYFVVLLIKSIFQNILQCKP